MRIEQVEARADGFERWVARWYEPWCAAYTQGQTAGLADPVLLSCGERLAKLRGHDAPERRFLLAAVDDDVVAGAALVSMPLRDNLGLVQAAIGVPTGHRRRGHGTALLHAVRDLAADAGRSTLLLDIDRPLDVSADAWPGTAFARRHGFTLRLENVRRDLRLPVDPARADALRGEALGHADGYRVECFAGRVAEQDRDRLAALLARMTTDAPMGDLDYEPEVWDAARVAAQEDEIEAMGIRWWTAVAVAADGAWAGFTQLGWSPQDPQRLLQWDTLVLAGHRGHRLGALMKLAAVAEAGRDAPQARRVVTWNAASNAPMIRVNEAMGFEPVESNEEWQADLSQLA